MYGWAIRPAACVEPSVAASVAATQTVSCTQSHVPTAAASSKQQTTAAASRSGVGAEPAGTDTTAGEDICKERRRLQRRHQKPKVRYAPATNCPFVTCGPTKPLRSFREKPDSCLPRRK